MRENLETVGPLVDPVWTQIAALADGRSHVRVLFTSSSTGAGTTLLSGATALSLARNMRAGVLHVETHIKNPTSAAYFGVDNSPGFSDLLLGHTEMEVAVRDVPGVKDLHCLPGGSPRPAIAGELATRGAQSLVQSLMTKARFVIFDAPPLTSHQEARSLLNYVDAVVIILRAGESMKSETAKLAELIGNTGVPILGTVLNRHRSEFEFIPSQLSFIKRRLNALVDRVRSR